MDNLILNDIVNELLCSSSSSSESSLGSMNEILLSDSDDEVLNIQKSFMKETRTKSSNHFIENVVNKYTEKEFRSHFRVSSRVAAILTHRFKNSVHYTIRINSGGRAPASPKSIVLAFLWFAGNELSHRDVSEMFNMSVSSAHRRMEQFLDFMFEISSQHIKFPETTIEKDKISNGFAEIAGIPNVLGCVGGCYVYIRKPEKRKVTGYVNSEGYVSITLQGVCDHRNKFMDIFVGASGSKHYSHVYDLSFLSKQISGICGDQYHLLGDQAYPLREYLLTPYRDLGDLDERQKKFNEKHSQTRATITNCLDLLKQRFRQLSRLDFFRLEKTSQFVLACCVIHNICIEEGDLWLEPIEPQDEVSYKEKYECEFPAPSVPHAVSHHKGMIKRDKIAESL